MKKIFLTVSMFLFFVSISFPSFASDIYGWWKSEEGNIKTPELVRITKDKFCGLDYKILDVSNNTIKLSLINSEDVTIIKVYSDDKISIATANGNTSSYKFITHNVSLTRKEVEELAKGH